MGTMIMQDIIEMINKKVLIELSWSKLRKQFSDSISWLSPSFEERFVPVMLFKEQDPLSYQ